ELGSRADEPGPELVHEAVLGEADLRHAVAVAERDRAVPHGVVIYGDAEGRSDLVLAPVPPADRARLIVVDGEVPLERLVDPVRALRLPILAQEWKHRGLVRREAGMQAEHDPHLALDLLLVVRVDQEREERAIDARGGLDDVGEVPLATLLVEVGEVPAAA